MTETYFLYGFLFVAFLLAPRMTQAFFLPGSNAYADAHKIALLLVLLGIFLDAPYLTIAWPSFCIFGFFLYLKKNSREFFSAQGLVVGVPFLFSFISSVWFVAGAFDAHLLGYNRTWSFYAALHGSFLGWLLVGSFAHLARREKSSSLYSLACYLSLAFFLLVAFGINGIPHIKGVGVIGFSLLVPITIGHYAFHAERARSTLFAGLSLLALACSMGLALLNEFWLAFPRALAGMPTMVLTHGLLNALIAVPCFFLAIRLERRERQRIESVVFFDDLCVLCNGTVSLLVRIDRKRKLRYSSLKGKLLQSLATRQNVPAGDSVVFWHEGAFYTRGEAVIQTLSLLGGAYSMIGFTLSLLPRFLLNVLYDLIARHRYRLFGKNDTCIVPSGAARDLFLP